jgi:asparagine synthase (glutamine-hydrolysing)
MGGLFGVVARDAADCGRLSRAIDDALNEREPGIAAWSSQQAHIGVVGQTSEDEPAHAPLQDAESGLVLTAVGRLDNRGELLRELRRPTSGCADDAATGSAINDSELIRRAYLRWGSDAPQRLYGDWALAAWHSRERRLFLARDQYGGAAVYYYADSHTFAFAPSPSPLLALGLAPPRVNELYLAQYLISLPEYHGPRAATEPLRLLAPAHCLEVTPERLSLRCYWHMEEQSEVRLPGGRSAYVERFRELFDDAVSARTRSRHPVATMLSAGLDSGAIAVTAAQLMRGGGDRLGAFTAAPLYHPTPQPSSRLVDERSLAMATAESAPNIDLEVVTAAAVSPIAGIRTALDLVGSPIHAAANMYWMCAVMEAARSGGHSVLLHGTSGNPGISWTGSVASQTVRYQLATMGSRGWARARVKRTLPDTARRRIAAARTPDDWFRASAIQPELALGLPLRELRLSQPAGPGLPERIDMLKPGRMQLGALATQLMAGFGLEQRDPTADVRLLSYVLSVPDSIFIEPISRTDRWLIREAMKGRMSDAVRLSTRRGAQASDLIPRLRASRDEVEATLDELQGGPAAQYVDVDHMRASWSLIEAEDTPRALRSAVSVLTRGIMGGLHVNAVEGFGSPSRIVAGSRLGP